ncbi:MAG: ergothioneine biosynthesis protein EgtB [Gammaproteobacteria bacterium]|nr:ergothioneine biosynthesis protein EgtB [Gammaproteobacteria bacterium]
MALRSQDIPHSNTPEDLTARYRSVRDTSLALGQHLAPEDFVIQSMQSVSPMKWHLAHTTWFFEQFILVERDTNYAGFDPAYDYLFNSYYQTKGQMHTRANRGLLSRPTVSEIRDYREHVDQAMLALLGRSADNELAFLVELGLNHEEQHQELMLTDIKHVFSINPLEPALIDTVAPQSPAPAPLAFQSFPGGLQSLGADGSGFAFDNETPAHEVLLQDFSIANRLITNAEYREFIDDGGYRDPGLWLSDAWAWLHEEAIDRPLYWSSDLATEFTLRGARDIDPRQPVCHVSFYEADAFARWAGARLPTEAEWECAAKTQTVAGHFADRAIYHPLGPADDSSPIAQIYGDAWEWTQSPYSPYPGFVPLAGSLGEYNGKFMCNQMVCRGGSCVTPTGHVRATYRNFFYPHERWQFFGIRLAK